MHEGIEQWQYREADTEIARAAKKLDREIALVDTVTAEPARIAPIAKSSAPAPASPAHHARSDPAGVAPAASAVTRRERYAEATSSQTT